MSCLLFGTIRYTHTECYRAYLDRLTCEKTKLDCIRQAEMIEEKMLLTLTYRSKHFESGLLFFPFCSILESII